MASVELTWTNNDDSPDGSIDVERSTDGFSTLTTVASGLSPTTTSYTDTTASEGTTYEYRIERITDHREATSTTVSFTTSVTAPSNTSLDTSIEDEITVSWTDNSSAEHGYNVYRSQDGTNFSQVANLAANTTSWTDTGKEDGEKYWYYVAAYDSNGESAGSTVSGITVLPSPSQITLDTSIEDEITINWAYNDDSSDGELQIYRSTADFLLGNQITWSSDFSVTSYTDTGLDDGEEYYYTLRRVTDHTSSDSTQHSGVTVLPAPSNASSSTVSGDQIDLSWADNSDNEGGFEIYRSQDGSTGTSLTTVGANTTSYSDTGLEDGEQYYYTIESYTEHTSSASGQTNSTTLLPSPSALSLDTSVEGEVTLSWTNNDDSSDGTLEVYRSTDGTLGTSVASFQTLTTTSHTDTDVIWDGEKYYYTIRRSTDHVNSDSTQQSGVTVLPAASNASASTVSGDQIDISWTDNAYNEDGYKIYRSQDGTKGSVVGTVTTSTTSYSDTGLEDGEKYYYAVDSYTEHTSSSSTSAEAASTTSLPAPSNTSTSTVSADQVDISWTNNDDSSDGNIDVERSSGGSAWTTAASGLVTTTTSYTDSSVSGGTDYQYRIERNTDHASSTSGTASVHVGFNIFIDGTQVQYVTIDGTSVQDITIDGTSVT